MRFWRLYIINQFVNKYTIAEHATMGRMIRQIESPDRLCLDKNNKHVTRPLGGLKTLSQEITILNKLTL